MASDWERTRKAHAALNYLTADLLRDDADMQRIAAHQLEQEPDFAEIAEWLAAENNVQSERVDSLLQKVLDSFTVYPRRGARACMGPRYSLPDLDGRRRTSAVSQHAADHARLELLLC